jgi:hypothetical protein
MELPRPRLRSAPGDRPGSPPDVVLRGRRSRPGRWGSNSTRRTLIADCDAVPVPDRRHRHCPTPRRQPRQAMPACSSRRNARLNSRGRLAERAAGRARRCDVWSGSPCPSGLRLRGRRPRPGRLGAANDGQEDAEGRPRRSQPRTVAVDVAPIPRRRPRHATPACSSQRNARLNSPATAARSAGPAAAARPAWVAARAGQEDIESRPRRYAAAVAAVHLGPAPHPPATPR